MITIDGSKMEGGGQILRTALALSAAFKQPFEISHLREGREKPGLGHQHLAALRAAAGLCGGEVGGDYLGSRAIRFFPGKTVQKSLTIKLETAASIPLVLQALVLPALLGPGPIEIKLRGGATDTFFSPSWDFFQHVFLKVLDGMGAKIEVETKKKGYYPEGGAEIYLKINPSVLEPRSFIRRGKLIRISILSGASSSLQGKKVAERQARGAKDVLSGLAGLPVQTETRYYQTSSPGSHVCLVAEFTDTILGADVLGTLGKRAEEVGKEAAVNLLSEEKTGACLDKRLADQILPFLAAASSKKIEVKTSEVTSHAKTNMWVIEKFVKGRFGTQGKSVSWMPQKSSR
jgi:RNA 3'-phosphate cyclase